MMYSFVFLLDTATTTCRYEGRVDGGGCVGAIDGADVATVCPMGADNGVMVSDPELSGIDTGAPDPDRGRCCCCCCCCWCCWS